MALLAVYTIAAAIAVSPICLVEIPALVDYPNHLARLHVLATFDRNPVLQDIYEIRWTILPNLAMDVLALPLTWVMPVADAGRVFIGFTLTLIVAGTAVLFRALHGRFSTWPVVTVAFIYNYLMFWGFLNYLFAVGVYLFAFAAWIFLENASPWKRFGIFSLVSAFLFFCHLFALGIYAITIVSYEFERSRHRPAGDRSSRPRFWGPTIGQFAAPAILWLLSPTSGGDTLTGYGSMSDKIDAIISPVLFYGGATDTIVAVSIVVTLCWAIYRRDLVFEGRILAPLVALCVAAALMPNMLMGVWGADFRLPFVLVCLLVAGTRWTITDRRIVAFMLVSAMTVAVVRTTIISEYWQQYDRQFAEFRKASIHIEEGANVLMAREEWRQELPRRVLPYWHLACLAIIDRSVFTPSFFTDPRKQPVIVQQRLRSIDPPDSRPILTSFLAHVADPGSSDRMRDLAIRRGVKPYWARWTERFDYVVVIHDGALDNPVPNHLEPIHIANFFTLYRVKS